MFAVLFLETNVIQFPNKFQSKNVSRFRDKFVPMCQKRNAALSHNKDAKTRKLIIVNKNVVTTTGAKNAHLVNNNQSIGKQNSSNSIDIL